MKEQLQFAHPQFLETLKEVLSSDKETSIQVPVFKDFFCYYDLHNPENFEDPDNSPDWYDSEGLWDVNTKPSGYIHKIDVYLNAEEVEVESLVDFIKKGSVVENRLLLAIEDYTFNDCGAYASGVCFHYAKTTIERSENQGYTVHEFLKRCMSVDSIELCDKGLRLHVLCAWDTEHGIEVTYDGECFSIE